ncbi:MAG: hypothetical protein KF709_12720 [Gemmatimonadaceae bacterium]|nr:hypothetical protein [Gemmatimonadaceae bacterium]
MRLRLAVDRRWLLSALAVAYASACGHLARPGEADSQMPESAGSIADAVMNWRVESQRWKERYLQRCWNAPVDSMEARWEVGEQDVARVLVAIHPDLSDALAGSGLLPGDYKAQLLGVKFRNQSAILVNGVNVALMSKHFYFEGSGRGPLVVDWKEGPIVPCDGGLIRFVAVVDSSGGILLPVRFNPRM